MANFIQYVVSQEDTIQGIAQSQLGDMSKWIDLAQFNNLRYPYIVDTVEEKMKNPNHLVTVGDTLMIPVSDDQTTGLISKLSTATQYDKEEIYALALGKDLDILPLPNGQGALSMNGEVLEMKSDGKGAIKTVRGLRNLLQSLYIRVITPKGSYIGHPEYGSEVHKYIGMKNTEENAALLDLEIERTLRTDSRVTGVISNGHTLVDNTYTASFSVSTMSLEQAFEFIVTSKANGPLVLLDNFRY